MFLKFGLRVIPPRRGSDYLVVCFCADVCVDLAWVLRLCVGMAFPCQFAMQLCYAACAISGDICYRLM